LISDRLVDRVTYTCSDICWDLLTDDKSICYSLLQQAGFPVPQTLAAIDSSMRSFNGARKIRSPAMLRDFLRGLNAYPIFAKSNLGMGSRRLHDLRRRRRSSATRAIRVDNVR